jgi:hypothetical protein
MIEQLTQWQELHNIARFKLEEAMALDDRKRVYVDEHGRYKILDLQLTEQMKEIVNLLNYIRDNMDQLAGIPNER